MVQAEARLRPAPSQAQAKQITNGGTRAAEKLEEGGNARNGISLALARYFDVSRCDGTATRGRDGYGAGAARGRAGKCMGMGMGGPRASKVEVRLVQAKTSSSEKLLSTPDAWAEWCLCISCMCRWRSICMGFMCKLCQTRRLLMCWERPSTCSKRCGPPLPKLPQVSVGSTVWHSPGALRARAMVINA